MGAVGLTFGTPTSGQGINVASTVASIKNNLQAQETPYQTQLSALQSQDTAISNLGTLLSTLSTDVSNLTSADGVLYGMEGSSSNTNVLQLISAGTGAVAGTHSITVSQLATTSSVYASAVGKTDVLSGSLTIAVGSGTPVTINVDSAFPTLASLAANINASGAGVTASVITGTSGQQLSLTSSTSGALGTISVTSALTDTTNGGAAVTFGTPSTGQDALLQIDGINASSSSNTVSNVLPGVVFQLLDTSPVTPINVVIVNNTTAVGSAVSTMIADYNAVIKALTAQEGKTTSGNPEPLFGSPLIATIQEQLDSAISVSTGSSSTAENLGTIGISVNSDGTLTLDATTLTTALNSDFASVIGVFQGVGGVGETLSAAVANTGTTGPDSVLTLAASENTTTETGLKKNISTLSSSISAQVVTLTASLNAANQALQLIPVQLQTVDELYSAITGYNKTTNG